MHYEKVSVSVRLFSLGGTYESNEKNRSKNLYISFSPVPCLYGFKLWRK